MFDSVSGGRVHANVGSHNNLIPTHSGHLAISSPSQHLCTPAPLQRGEWEIVSTTWSPRCQKYPRGFLKGEFVDCKHKFNQLEKLDECAKAAWSCPDYVCLCLPLLTFDCCWSLLTFSYLCLPLLNMYLCLIPLLLLLLSLLIPSCELLVLTGPYLTFLLGFTWPD